MKFIICALYYNNWWERTQFNSLTGEKTMFYIEDKGFRVSRVADVATATDYDYEDAIEKLDKLNKKHSNEYPEHNFVLISSTFKRNRTFL